MENYTLSQDKIDKLFQFCIQHGIKYYDVQVELVDHLASAIETKMSNNPNITFEDCLQKEYKRFGITGFSYLLSERKKEIEKSIRKKRIEILKKSITPPMLFITLGVLCLPIYLIYYKEIVLMKYLDIICLNIVMFIGLFWVAQIIFFRRQRKKTMSGVKHLKIMMEDVPLQWQAITFFITLSNSIQGWSQFMRYKEDSDFRIIALWLLLNTISCFMLILFVKENTKLHEYTKRNYPDAFIK